jgi:glyoxylase-like metal-dependent hydrolase (beta-lactamase superfamily II)
LGPIRPVPVTDWMRDYETREIAGLRWETVPTPGMTNGASSYVVTLPESGPPAGVRRRGDLLR